MMDRFLWGSVSRISPEAPVPVVRVDRETVSLGGAGNVAQNIVALGGSALPIGLLGEDAEGGQLAAQFQRSGMPTDGSTAASSSRSNRTTCW